MASTFSKMFLDLSAEAALRIYKVLIDPNHFFNRGGSSLPKTSLAGSYLCQMHGLLLAPLLCSMLQEMLCRA